SSARNRRGQHRNRIVTRTERSQKYDSQSNASCPQDPGPPGKKASLFMVLGHLAVADDNSNTGRRQRMPWPLTLLMQQLRERTAKLAGASLWNRLQLPLFHKTVKLTIIAVSSKFFRIERCRIVDPGCYALPYFRKHAFLF